jgi:hypothetical protein
MFLAPAQTREVSIILLNDAAARDRTVTVYLSFFIATLLIALAFYAPGSVLPDTAPAAHFGLTRGEVALWRNTLELNERHSVMAKLKRAAHKSATKSSP